MTEETKDQEQQSTSVPQVKQPAVAFWRTNKFLLSVFVLLAILVVGAQLSLRKKTETNAMVADAPVQCQQAYADVVALSKASEQKPVDAIEIFSFTCPHCAKTEPFVEKAEADGKNILRLHAVFNEKTVLLAAKMHELVAMGKKSAFSDAFVTVTEGRDLDAQFAERNNLSKEQSEQFLKAIDNEHNRQMLNATTKLMESCMIMSVPTFVYNNGKNKTTPSKFGSGQDAYEKAVIEATGGM